MSKKKKAKSKRALPKRLAGIKLPKAVRQGGLAALATSPQGAKLMAELLAAAGGVVLAKKGADAVAPGGDAASAAQGKLQQGGGAIAASGQAVTYALGEAARSFLQALKDGGEPPPAPKEPATPRRPAAPQPGPAAH
jgi:hypothetical protein